MDAPKSTGGQMPTAHQNTQKLIALLGKNYKSGELSRNPINPDSSDEQHIEAINRSLEKGLIGHNATRALDVFKTAKSSALGKEAFDKIKASFWAKVLTDEQRIEFFPIQTAVADNGQKGAGEGGTFSPTNTAHVDISHSSQSSVNGDESEHKEAQGPVHSDDNLVSENGQESKSSVMDYINKAMEFLSQKVSVMNTYLSGFIDQGSKLHNAWSAVVKQFNDLKDYAKNLFTRKEEEQQSAGSESEADGQSQEHQNVLMAALSKLIAAVNILYSATLGKVFDPLFGKLSTVAPDLSQVKSWPESAKNLASGAYEAVHGYVQPVIDKFSNMFSENSNDSVGSDTSQVGVGPEMGQID